MPKGENKHETGERNVKCGKKGNDVDEEGK